VSPTTTSSLTAAVAPIAAGDAVASLAFLGDAAALALAGGKVMLWSDGGARLIDAHPDGAIIAGASDGRRLVTGGDDGRLVATDKDGVTTLLAQEDNKWIDAVTTRPDGAVAWTAGRSAAARSPQGEIKRLLSPLPSTSRGIAFFPKGYRLAIAHYNGVALWFPNTGAAPETLEWKGSHLDATVSPDGRFVITSMQENTLHGWRLADNKNLRMAGYPAKTRSLSWSPDGKWLATSGADACILWPFTGKDGPMGQAPRECGVRAGVQVTRVAFHPAALVVAIGYEDGMVLLCRVADASEILAKRPAESPDKARISALAWDARGARLAFGADSGEAGVLTLPAA
jgi:WD40 repeat protein